MRKLYSAPSRIDAGVLLSAWIAPGPRARLISVCAFRNECELLSTTYRVDDDDARSLTEILPPLIDALETRLVAVH